MTTLKIQDHVFDRAVFVAGAAICAELPELDDIIKRIAQVAPELANDVESAANYAICIGAADAWLDGFQCGRDPGRLVIVQDGAR